MPRRRSSRLSTPTVSGGAAAAHGSPPTVSYSAAPAPSAHQEAVLSKFYGRVFEYVYWPTFLDKEGKEYIPEGVPPLTHPARVTSVGFDNGDPYVRASWMGGEDDGKEILINKPGADPSCSLTDQLPLTDFFEAASANFLNSPDFFEGGFLGITLSEGVTRLWYDIHKSGTHMTSPASRLGTNSSKPPTSWLQFDEDSLELLNHNAEADGLRLATPGTLLLALVEPLHLLEIIRADGSLDMEAFKRLGLNRPPTHPNVAPFVLEDKHIKGRRGLNPGDFGLETTGHVSRLELFTIYAGVYMTQEEALTDKATRNVQFATTLVSASDVITEDIYVYINPARSTLKAEHGNVGLFANDVSMDLKDEHGERNVGAFEPTCEFVPFTFFHFPMVAMFAKSGLGNKQEIAGDYGDDFKI